MKSVKLSVITTVIVCAAAILAVPFQAAADANCSFNSQLDADVYSYNIAATSEDSWKKKSSTFRTLRTGKSSPILTFSPI